VLVRAWFRYRAYLTNEGWCCAVRPTPIGFGRSEIVKVFKEITVVPIFCL
jgi:hypothetical protein